MDRALRTCVVWICAAIGAAALMVALLMFAIADRVERGGPLKKAVKPKPKPMPEAALALPGFFTFSKEYQEKAKLELEAQEASMKKP